MNSNRGFTIIELMITVAVAGTMLALGVPAFGDWMKSSRMVTQTNNLVTSIQLARAEAITRNDTVRIEPFTTGTDWSGGWQVVDVSSGDVIRVFDAVNGSTLTSTSGTISFNDDGSINTPVTLTLRANTCDGDYQRFIRIIASGVYRLHNDYACATSNPF